MKVSVAENDVIGKKRINIQTGLSLNRVTPQNIPLIVFRCLLWCFFEIQIAARKIDKHKAKTY